MKAGDKVISRGEVFELIEIRLDSCILKRKDGSVKAEWKWNLKPFLTEPIQPHENPLQFAERLMKEPGVTSVKIHCLEVGPGVWKTEIVTNLETYTI